MRILSGLQPSGRLHLGNYFGMMEPSLRLQHQGDAYYFIADFHSLTTIRDPKALRENVLHLAVDFLACGLDPDKCVFWRQSDVPEVAELAWMLSTACPMGLLERCTSYKDKVARGLEATHGLFAYPTLMAADILMFDSDVVPVGRDQKQHVEVTRDLAMKMNQRYGEGLLRLPEPRIKEDTAVVPGTDGQKMSKSYNNILAIFEEEKPLRKKVMSIKTDSAAVEDPKDPEGSIIAQLYKLVASPEDLARMEQDFRAGGFGYGDFKQRLFEAVWIRFEAERVKRAELLANLDHVEAILRRGAEKAREVAAKTMDRMRKAVGLR